MLPRPASVPERADGAIVGLRGGTARTMKLPLDVHDGAIVSYRRDERGLDVVVTQYDGTLRTLRFEEVHALHDLAAVEGYDPSCPEGSLDYVDEAQYGALLSAVRERVVRGGGAGDEVQGLRQFDFRSVGNREMLSVVARRVVILPGGADGVDTLPDSG